MIFLMFVLVFASCEDDDSPVGNNRRPVDTREWLIDESQVFDGGPGKDGIPALQNPEFIDAAMASYLNPEDLVIGYVYEGTARAYPHAILDWHEIINDQMDDHLFAITYCPLTGTASNWSRLLEGLETTFGVSGLLYNSNLMPYDRTTESLWSQMRLDCVNGVLVGKETPLFHVVETSWETWTTLYPDTKVVSLNTGYDRSYGDYPYTRGPQDYREDDFLLFPVNNSDDRLHAKERVLGIIHDGNAKAYRFESFEEEAIAEDVVGGEKVVVYGSATKNILIAFYAEDQQFTIEGDGLFSDERGNEYDAFGYVVNGPAQGDRLKPTRSYIGYWFSWAAFYPSIEIFQE